MAAKDALTAARQAGCDDPLVRYFDISRNPPNISWKARYEAEKELVAEFEARKLPPRRMLHARWNLAMAGHMRDRPASLDGVDTGPLMDRFWDEFVGIAKRRDAAADGDLYEVFDLVEAHYRRMDPDQDRMAGYRRTVAALDAADASAWLRRAIEANFLVSYAWDARGIGTGDTVTPDGWVRFRERLEKAGAAAKAAYEADPLRPGPANQMIQVAIGLGYPRDEMETWFRRAMEADPDDSNACWRKQEYLNPKWHGTPNELKRFMHQCIRTKNYYASLPLITHRYYQREIGLVPEYRRGLVGRGIDLAIFREAFEPHLKANPTDSPARANYFAICCIVDDPKAAEWHLRALGGDIKWFQWGQLTADDLMKRYEEIGGKPVPVAGKK